MPFTEEMLARARKLDRHATELLLSEVYPAVWRMAHALTGRNDAARYVANSVFRMALRVMPVWRKGLMAENWFYHHTLLNSRPFAAEPPAAKKDLLVIAAEGVESPEYLAFISALRKLPFQQREAFVLHHGEHFNERLLGIAMDSSTTAATTHLRAATEALAAVAGEKVPELTLKLSHAYAKLSPTEQTVIPYVRREVSRAIWRRRIRRLVRRVVLLAVLGGLAYIGWKYRAQIIERYHEFRNQSQPPATQPVK